MVKKNSIKELEKIVVYAEDIIEFLMLGKCQRGKAIIYAEKIITEVNNLQQSYQEFKDSL